jgi:uncharacterized membrane protein YjjP (DUF1212 family)
LRSAADPRDDPAVSESRETYKTLDLALRIGEMLLSNGAGAPDVTATMLAVTRSEGLRSVSADVTFTELTLIHHPSIDDPAVIQSRRVNHRENDYEDLTLVDHLVRDLLAKEVTRDEARARMAQLASSGHRRPRWSITVGWGVMGIGTVVLLGGGLLISLVAFVSFVGIDRIQRFMSIRRLPGFYQQVAGALFATLVAVAVGAADLDVTPARAVTAGIIYLLAGLGFVGAMQDALAGFPLTAGARILEVMLATAGIIAGVSGGLAVGSLVGVQLAPLQVGRPDLGDASLIIVGASVAAAAFAYASYAPLRALFPTALMAGLGQLVYAGVAETQLGATWATASAAVTIGAVSYTVGGQIRVPPFILVVPAVVPLLPGLAIYRGLTFLAEGEEGMLHLAAAGATALALASGVILGQYLAQPLRREARRLETRLAGPRLVGPLKVRSRRARSVRTLE